MMAIDDLQVQNHKLTEASNVLVYLLQDRSMCDTDTATGILYDFIDLLFEHFKQVDSLYQSLLTGSGSEAGFTAEKFMSGEIELKRIINSYISKWCIKDRKQLKIADHAKFMTETSDLFKFVLSRIQDETENLYPLIRATEKTAA